jgi:mannose-6-phosphate isomerase-like protein (cupin superfamily)
LKTALSEAFAQLDRTSGQLFTKMMEHGSMSVEIYRPIKTDLQTPHKQDELYVVISGSGESFNDGNRTPFKHNDVLFAAAGASHRFENFTEDLATWVIFYGPEGGERR